MSSNKPDCSRHSKQVGGFTDMKLLAEAIGDLHYGTLAELFSHLSSKLARDGIKDAEAGRCSLAGELHAASRNLNNAFNNIESAWMFSSPFMDKPNTQSLNQ